MLSMNQYIKNTFWFLSCFILCGILLGCKTTTSEKPKDPSKVNPEKYLGKMRIFLEVHEDGIRSQNVKVLRRRPIEVSIDQSPILTESLMQEIRLVNNQYGFHLEVQFDQRGTWLLESYTATNGGKRLAIFVDYPEQQWIAAPIIRTRLADGKLVIIPDASVEEANRIAMTVMNSIRKIKKIKKPKKDKPSNGSTTSRTTKLKNPHSKK